MAPITVIAAPTTRQSARAKAVERHAERNLDGAKVKKYMLDSSPTSAADSASSSARSGAMTPIELRRNWLTM